MTKSGITKVRPTIEIYYFIIMKNIFLILKDDHRLHVLIVKDNRKLATKYQPFNANIHSFMSSSLSPYFPQHRFLFISLPS